MTDKSFIFLAGHHRSGTSLLHEIIKEHPLISGFSNTGVPEDEGMFLQNVYEPAKTYGGPGKYIFDKNSHMDENHPLATVENANSILQQWEKYYDKNCPYYVEKSPPSRPLIAPATPKPIEGSERSTALRLITSSPQHSKITLPNIILSQWDID